MAISTQARPALIFIPDISGFTQFVSETELKHSQHIITELLETLINANQIGLEISEIEGDAILFYRFCEGLSASEVLEQVEKMFVLFHEHLSRYENRRICQCGACKTAHKLTLKFVTHYGDIALNKIGDHLKLFGKEVIVAHRLLKNDIPHHEYALFTEPLCSACASWEKADSIAWSDIELGNQIYDSGPIQYQYLALKNLMKKVKSVEKLPPMMQSEPIKMIELTHLFKVPAEVLLEKLIDFDLRPQWAGVGIEMITPHGVNQEGTIHQCILPDSNQRPEFITENFQIEKNKFSFDETDTKGRFSNRWILEKKDDDNTLLRLEGWVKNNFFIKTFFKFFAKPKLEKSSLDGLNKLEKILDQEFKEKGSWQKNMVI